MAVGDSPPESLDDHHEVHDHHDDHDHHYVHYHDDIKDGADHDELISVQNRKVLLFTSWDIQYSMRSLLPIRCLLDSGNNGK